MRTLHELARLLLPTQPTLAPVLARLGALASRGEPLHNEERRQLSLLIGMLETLFN